MSSPGERVGALASLVGGRVIGSPDVVVHDVTHDSRLAGDNVAFVAVRGFTRDGHRFVDDVVEAGCPVVVVDHAVDTQAVQIVVEDTRAVLGRLAAAVHGNPSRSLVVVGVTGTNGKTSVTHMVESIARQAGKTTGLVGTLGMRIGDRIVDSAHTTPESTDLQRILAEMSEDGVDIVAMEVSSHAIELGRVDGVHFSLAAFTNLSRDHLDFHGDMESYFAVKSRLFGPDRCDRAVVCVDDEWGRRLARSTQVPIVTVSSGDEPAAVTVTIVRETMRGTEFDLRLPDGRAGRVALPIPGRFSVANAAVAAASCVEWCGLEAIVAGLGAVPPIPGRFEVVSGQGSIVVVVDYSHTPAGIEAAIATARPLTVGRVIAVIGAGGDRDTSKRPQMGAAASGADLVVVTSDNPRSEPPGAIMAAVTAGVTAPMQAIEDRREAIFRAIREARPGDTVLVMGKGHEPYQELATGRIPFDDRVVSREALAERGDGDA